MVNAALPTNDYLQSGINQTCRGLNEAYQVTISNVPRLHLNWSHMELHYFIFFLYIFLPLLKECRLEKSINDRKKLMLQ